MNKRSFLLSVAMTMLALILPANGVKGEDTTAPTPVVTLNNLAIQDYPYKVDDTTAETIFNIKGSITIAVDVTTPSSLSGRQAFICACDPTQAAVSSATGIGTEVSPYTALGANGNSVGYFTSSKDGDRYTVGSNLSVSTNYKAVYVIDVDNTTVYFYINGTLITSKNGNWCKGFAALAIHETYGENKAIYIGAGVTSSGTQDSFSGTINSVQIFDGTLTADEVAAIEYPESEISEEITEAVSNANNMDIYGLQKYYGLVTDAGNGIDGDGQLTCNYPASTSQESGNAYANLIDGTYSTYFHSGYSSTLGDGSAHYLQADLKKHVNKFRFYYKKRSNTNNNRPTSITIQGSNDGSNFNDIKTISSGLPTDANVTCYYSDAIECEKAYRYLRFVVNSTNTSTTFFALSEFYILPCNPRVEEVFNAIKNWNAGKTDATAEALSSAYYFCETMRTGTPYADKEYFLYSDTYDNEEFVNRYMYNNNGTLTLSTTNERSDVYKWTAAYNGTYFTFANGDGTYYLAHKAVSGTAYNFTVAASTRHAGVTLYSVADERYFVVKNDGTKFDQADKTYDQTNDSWCTDFVFIPSNYLEGYYTLTVESNINDVTYSWNGYEFASSITVLGSDVITEATLTSSGNSLYTFDGFYSDAGYTTSLGTEYELNSLSENTTIYAKFTYAPDVTKKYYLYANTYNGSTYIPRYLYNNNGTLATSTSCLELNENYLWTLTKNSDGSYSFANGVEGYYIANNSNYYMSIGTTAACYKFLEDAVTSGSISIYNCASYSGGKYMTISADGTSFNRNSKVANTTSWCTDFVLVEANEHEDEYVINFTVNSTGANGSITWNRETQTLPACFIVSKEAEISDPSVTITTGNGAYELDGIYEYNSENKLGTSLSLKPDANVTYEVKFNFAIFSASTNEDDLVPVRIYNYRYQGYDIRLNTADSYSGNAVNSGTSEYAENEIWYLVGDETSFKMYSRVAGNTLALKLAGTSEGSAATMADADEAASLTLTDQGNGSYYISPVANTAQSFNMYGGVGKDIKLFSISDGGSTWCFNRINPNPLAIKYTASLEGGYATNTRIGNLALNVNGTTSNVSLTTDSDIPETQALYLPVDATFGASVGTLYHGWTMNINGVSEIAEQTIPDDGLDITINITVDDDNKYQYLYYSNDANGHPYRIPSIATAANGTIFAISDNRPCGADIGNGEVDVKCRISTDNGETWGEEFYIANGDGGNSKRMETGYGDASSVVDRDSNKLLVMMVCGRTVFWNGNWTTDADEEASVNRVARVYATCDESTGDWTWSNPEEVTNSIYSLFLDEDNTVTVPSLFIASGRICQSRIVKKGDYYRLYCAILSSSEGNRVIYSDDFGATWNVLGSISDRPAPSGDEPKCEELPDGSVLLSSRKSYGRYFNIFTFDDESMTTGEWGTVVSSNNVTNGLSFGSNSCNGEIYKINAIRKSDGTICELLLQSAPTGNSRSNVSIFYKELTEETYTPTTIAQGWTKKEISTIGSAYSTMTLQADGRIGFFYEEEPNNYCMVYVPLTIEEITDDAYSLYEVHSTISDYGMGTFYATQAMTIPEGISAYVAKEQPDLEKKMISMEEITDGIIPAKTGVVITGEPATYDFVPSIGYGTPVDDNLLVGYEAADTLATNYGDVSIESDKNIYILTTGNNGFGFYHKSADFKVKNNKAYLVAEGSSTAAAALAITFNGSGTTGIAPVTAGTDDSNDIYDLTGRKIANPTQSGIYIIGNKKTFIKR